MDEEKHLVVDEDGAEELSRKITISLAGTGLITVHEIPEVRVLISETILTTVAEKNNRVINF